MLIPSQYAPVPRSTEFVSSLNSLSTLSCDCLLYTSWAKSVDVCPENASRFLVDKPNPGLTALFVDAFRQQTEAQKDVTSEKATERDPEVVAWENDEITSIEVKTVEVKSPFAPLPEEAPKAHRLTAEEKEIKAAVMDTLKGQIAYHNDGMRATYRSSNHSFNLLARNGVRIEGNTVTQLSLIHI